MKKISVVIPYQHSEEREPLLKMCLRTLPDLVDYNIEVCVHEMGKQRLLHLGSQVKYAFTRFEGEFDRARALNIGVKKLASGEMLALIDGDLLFPRMWIYELIQADQPSVAWGKIKYLSLAGTELYRWYGRINDDYVWKTVEPKVRCAAGGATFIPQKLFYEVGGIPEEVENKWGGEDNLFWAKLKAFGYPFKTFRSIVYHLWHERTTPKMTEDKLKVVRGMIEWPPEKWKQRVKVVGTRWGDETLLAST